MDVEALLSEAIAASGGLTDFGADHFREPLSVLVRCLNAQSGVSVLGERLLRDRITEHLRNRLVVERYFAEVPEIEAEEINAPIVIVGLPRTGTTLLQRILSVDSRLHSLLWWEARFPAPVVDPRLPGEDPRISTAKAEVQAMIEANPDLLSIHPFDATAADEDGLLLEMTFRSFYNAYADIPEYTYWLEQTDSKDSYVYLKRLLKFLQWQKRQRGITAGPWVLKTPYHLLQMDAMFSIFPDARVIQTHRDPIEVIPSLISFYFNLWQVYMDNPDPLRAGQQVEEQWKGAIEKVFAFRQRAGDDRFLDIQFADTVAKPFEVMERIYAFLSLPFPDDTKQEATKFLEANRRDRRPAHLRAEIYGVSEQMITEDFVDYRKRFVTNV